MSSNSRMHPRSDGMLYTPKKPALYGYWVSKVPHGVDVPFNSLAGGFPTEKLKQELVSLFEATDVQLEAIAQWLTDTNNPIPTTMIELAMIAKSVGIEESVLNEQFALIRFLLRNWRQNKLTIDLVVRDLGDLGLEGEELRKATRFFISLEPSKEHYFEAHLKSDAEITGLPTIDNVSMTWNVRPLFATTPQSSTDLDLESMIEYVSQTHLLIIEILASSKSGKKASLSVQLSESEFEELEKSLTRARKQLDILKRKRFL